MKSSPKPRQFWQALASDKETVEQTPRLMMRVLRNRHVWIAAVITALLVSVYYHEVFQDVWGVGQIGSFLSFGLTRATIWRILFLVPVIYVAVTLGIGGGLSMLILVTAVMFPRIFSISSAQVEALFETIAVLVVGALVLLLLWILQVDRQRLAHLERTQNQLNLQVKRLSMLHVISGIVSQSLQLNQVMSEAVDKLCQLMAIDATWIHLWEPTKGELKLASANGLSPMNDADRDRLAGSLLPIVTRAVREPTVIPSVLADPSFKGTILLREGLQTVVFVPLLSRGEPVGCLSVGSRTEREFAADELDLLQAIGDQISVAIENARSYEREHRAAEALRESERSYRELFENASDAIWVHDLSGVIVAANPAMEKLTGFTRGELVGGNVSMFLTNEGLEQVEREAHQKVLRGQYAPPYEQTLVRRDRTEVAVRIGTNLLLKNRHPWAFQHIGHDVTEEKRIQDNLRYYVQQVSQAQEAERKRIARELHDETAQALVVVARNLDDLANGNSKVTANDIREQVRNILKEVRNFSQQLRPSVLDDLGLVPALKWLATDLTNNWNIATEVQVAGQPRQLSKEAELVFFRIAQESMTNARRHAKASKVQVKLEFSDKSVKMTVSDNGAGFEIPQRVSDFARIGKLGLAGMQERAKLIGGTSSIQSTPGLGTSVILEAPA
ncbi:MAG: PAS domain S-box protein [Chloroflexota bacterium]